MSPLSTAFSDDASREAELHVLPYQPLTAYTYIRTLSRLAATRKVVNDWNVGDEKPLVRSLLV